MKILVISDSHNVILDSQIQDIKEEGRFDLLIHCGDKYNDAEQFAERLNIEKVLSVPGNCDYKVIGMSPTIIQEIEGKKFIITHGHLFYVKISLNQLRDFAEKHEADVVLYGHTHKAYNMIIDNTLFFNPGSTIFPNDGRASFGVIEIINDKVSGKIVSISN